MNVLVGLLRDSEAQGQYRTNSMRSEMNQPDDEAVTDAMLPFSPLPTKHLGQPGRILCRVKVLQSQKSPNPL